MRHILCGKEKDRSTSLSETAERYGPVITAMYDAELFGHWWFEGPDWLEQLFREIHRSNVHFRTITPSRVFEYETSVRQGLQVERAVLCRAGVKGVTAMSG